MPSKKNKNKQSNHIPKSAPGQRALGVTQTWNLRQVIPVTMSQSVPVSQNYDFAVVVDANGWRVRIVDATTLNPISSAGANHGALTGQFSDLSGLWESYRVNSIYAKFTPTALQALGCTTATISIVDTVAGPGANDFPGSIANFSRSKTMQMHTPYASIARTCDLSNWIDQCVPNPYLRTILDTNPISREVYMQDGIGRLPAIQMAGSIAYVNNYSDRIVIGVLEVNAAMTFRGRRLNGQDLPGQIQWQFAEPCQLSGPANRGKGAISSPGDGDEEAKSCADLEDLTLSTKADLRALLKTMKHMGK